jgi:uncharacterized protein YggU (UPF0235/DUF167 family)
VKKGGTTIKLGIKAIPGSSRNCVAGWLGGTLKVCVSAPAERGKANEAIELVVAEALGISSACVQVVAGTTSSRKVVEIAGLPDKEIYRRLKP